MNDPQAFGPQSPPETTMSFSCFIVGEGTLPIRCAEILLERGHHVSGVISDDAVFARWAHDHALPVISPATHVVETLNERPFDYLFSIVNNRILPKEVFGLPRKRTINYHDGPLPKYAGTHATSWALINRETAHGVTWHGVAEVVDAGEILVQRRVPIDPAETAITLNAKCYEAAIASFEQLVEELSLGRERPRRQNLEERTFYRRFDRPHRANVLSWNDDAEELSALVRALDFGPYPNPMGTARWWIADDIVLVRRLDQLASASSTPPGTILKIDREKIVVSTATSDVALRKLASLNGRELPTDEVAAMYGLTEGHRLDAVSDSLTQQLTHLAASCARHESFWVDRLASLQPLSLSKGTRSTADTSGTTPAEAVRAPISEAFVSRARVNFPASKAGEVVMAALVAFLARLGGELAFDIGYSDDTLQADTAGAGRLYAPAVPLRVEIAPTLGIDALLAALRADAELLGERKTFGLDIASRYPRLRSATTMTAGPWCPLSIVRTAAFDKIRPWRGTALTILVTDEGEGLWLHDTTHFSRHDVEQMIDRFGAFLGLVVLDPGRPVGELPLLSGEEQRRLSVEWNATAAEYPREQSVAGLFELQVQRTPAAVAVVFEGVSLSYRELDERANRLARYLAGLGVGRGVLVGVCVERSLEMLVAVLGLLKSGGTYVPLDPGFPRDRLGFMAEDADLGLILTTEVSREFLPEFGGVVVSVDGQSSQIAACSGESLGVTVGIEDLAYVLYTSGSTGRPKGVEVSHRALTNFLWAMRDRPGFGEGDVLLAVTTLSFDIAGLELYLPLITGGCVVVASRPVSADGRRLQELLVSSGATVMQATPATWRMLIEAGWSGTPGLKVLCGGEGLPRELANQLLKRVPEVWNMYGPTETTIWSSVQQITSGDAEITIGRPIANTEFFIVDKQLQLVPIGVPGELLIGGDGLANGYRNRPELTAQQFIAHPFSDVAGARVYRTGDLVRYRDDGQVVHMGRLDHQVKIRGFRIELGEIETSLNQHPKVANGVVVARHDHEGAAYLAAYVVAAPGTHPTIGELRRFLQSNLPDYMVPAAFVYLDAFPLTPNGKIDRRSLPEPDHARPSLDNVYVAPRTPTEHTLTEIWRELLNVERVGIYDDFFELGGQSLLAAQMIARIDSSFGVGVQLRTLLAQPSVAGLAGAIEQATTALGDDEVLSALLDELESMSVEATNDDISSKDPGAS